MNPILVIARLTFRESSRRKIAATALALGIAFLIIFSIGFRLIVANINTSTSGEISGNVMRAEAYNALMLAGLYAVTFLSVAMAALLASDTLAGEINSGIVQTIAAKPIRRSDIVLGKLLGYAALLALYQVLMSGGVILNIYLQSGYLAPNLLAGVALIYIESLVILCISMLCSSALSALATGSIVFGLWGLAFIGGWVEQIGTALQSTTAVNVGIVTSLIIPSESLWRRASYEMQSPIVGSLGFSPFGTVSVPSLLMIVYAALYLVGAVLLTLRVFGKRDL